MNNFKILLTTLAILIALVGASASIPPKIQPDYIWVKGQYPSCPIGIVNSHCQVTSVGILCTFQTGLRHYFAIDESEPICMEGKVLKMP